MPMPSSKGGTCTLFQAPVPLRPASPLIADLRKSANAGAHKAYKLVSEGTIVTDAIAMISHTQLPLSAFRLHAAT